MDPRWQKAASKYAATLTELSQFETGDDPIEFDTEIFLPAGVNPVGDEIVMLRDQIQSEAGKWLVWCERGPLLLFRPGREWRVVPEIGMGAFCEAGYQELLDWLERTRLSQARAKTRAELIQILRAALFRFPVKE